MSQQNVQGNDKFERLELNSDDLGKGTNPRVTVRLNNGTELVFEMEARSGNFEAMAAWATETAEALKTLGK